MCAPAAPPPAPRRLGGYGPLLTWHAVPLAAYGEGEGIDPEGAVGSSGDGGVGVVGVRVGAGAGVGVGAGVAAGVGAGWGEERGEERGATPLAGGLLALVPVGQAEHAPLVLVTTLAAAVGATVSLLRSTVQVPALAAPQLAPRVPPRRAPGGSGQLGTPGVRPRPLGAPPPPQGLKRAASKVADSTRVWPSRLRAVSQASRGAQGLDTFRSRDLP